MIIKAPRHIIFYFSTPSAAVANASISQPHNVFNRWVIICIDGIGSRFPLLTNSSVLSCAPKFNYYNYDALSSVCCVISRTPIFITRRNECNVLLYAKFSAGLQSICLVGQCLTVADSTFSPCSSRRVLYYKGNNFVSYKLQHNIKIQTSGKGNLPHNIQSVCALSVIALCWYMLI